MATKWDCAVTIAFTQEYKTRECLWNFKSPVYKNKHMSDAAYQKVVEAMNIEGFGVPEVKNEIKKKLRSTYAQELKKIEESKKSGAGVDNIYESNIQWLKELEPVYKNADTRKTLDNVSNFIFYSVTLKHNVHVWCHVQWVRILFKHESDINYTP